MRDEDGDLIVEFSMNFAEFEFIEVISKNGRKIGFKQLLARLNSLTMPFSPIWKAVTTTYPSVCQDLGYTQKKVGESLYFHPWIMD